MKRFTSVRVGIAILFVLIATIQTQTSHAATIHTVINTANSGAGSLRQAILDAVDGDTINFDSSLAGSTIILSSVIIIDKDITIDGSGLSSHVQISGWNSVQIFSVDYDSTIIVNHLDIINGYTVSYGGGILNNGNLSVSNSNFSGNNANSGGAIFNGYTLVVSNSTFTNNHAESGGGINNGSYADATITNCVFSENTSTSIGGAISNFGSMNISTNTFSDNSSQNGGGINNLAALTVTSSTFTGNIATLFGGAIHNQADPEIITLTVLSSTFSGNDAHNGGAIYNGEYAQVSNSTFSQNLAVSDGGGIYNSDVGTIEVINSTLSENDTGGDGASIDNWGQLTLKNTILANSLNGNDCYNQDSDSIYQDVNNLIVTNGPSGHQCGTPSYYEDPLLDELADNGGPTETLALLPGSPAIDHGDVTTCSNTPVDNFDQRGVSRPQGDQCDIGAFEASVTPGFLFADDFETGDFSLWSRYNDGGGFLYACKQAAINGIWGACVERGTNDKRKQLIDETPINQTSFAARISFDINGLSMAEGERFRFMQGKMIALRPFFIVLRYLNGVYEIQLNTMRDDLTKTKSNWYLLTNTPHTIEVDWQAAGGIGANDGFARLYIDDVLRQELYGLDNDTFFITNFTLGFTSRLDDKLIYGIFYIDDVATSNNGHIGVP